MALTSASPYLRVVDMDRQIAERAAAIRAAHGYRTPDAIHLATADVIGADVFVTNDARLLRFGAVRVVAVNALTGP